MFHFYWNHDICRKVETKIILDFSFNIVDIVDKIVDIVDRYIVDIVDKIDIIDKIVIVHPLLQIENTLCL